MDISPYIFLSSIILGMNIIPFFMPPTWTVLAFFVVKYNLNLLPVILIGATFATLGRVILANISRKYFRRFFSKDSQSNYDSIGKYLNKHENVTIPLIILYAFLPIPSNDVYIAAGLAKVRLKLLAVSFFMGRLISYTFWVNLSQKFSDNITDIFSNHYSKLGSVLVELAGILVIYFIGKIAWKKILNRIDN